jgi:hypothetical protein
MAVWGSTTTAMFSLGSLLFTESMPQQVKESQSMDQQYFKEKRYRDRYRQLFRFLKHAGQFLGRTYLVSVWSGCHFIVTAFASILIGLYFIFMTTEKHNLNTYALITLLYHKPPPIKAYHN